VLVVKFKSVKICCSCERVNSGDNLVASNADSVICLVPVVADVKVSEIVFFVASSVLLKLRMELSERWPLTDIMWRASKPDPRANGAERLSGRKPGARVLIPPGYFTQGNDGDHTHGNDGIAGVGDQRWVVILTDLKWWSSSLTVMNSEHWLVKFKICCCMTNDDSEITNISCNYIVILHDFANFKTFSKAENRLKTSKRMEQSRRR
jgi:hypothetical protein